MDIRRFITRKNDVDETKEFKKEAISKLANVAQSIIERFENKDRRFHDIPVQFERRGS